MRPLIDITTLARAVVRHRTWTAGAWLAAVLAAGAFAAKLPAVVKGGADPIPGSETGWVIRAIDGALGRGAYYQTPIVVRNPGLSSDDLRFAAAVGDLAHALESSPVVRRVHTYWDSGSREMLGRDGHSALILVTPDVGSFSEAEAVTPVLRDTLRARLTPGFEANLTGTTAMLYDLDTRSSSDLLAAERVGIPLTLVILLVMFQSPLAALLPIVLALAAIMLCNAALFFLSRVFPVSVFAENVVSMIGLGVGVDYALFILSRFRAERRSGVTAGEASSIALAEVGGAVLGSAATVAAGFLALFLVDAPFLRAVAIGGICVVAAAAGAALTLLPVLLAWLGPLLDWPRRTAGPPRRRPEHGGPWHRWAQLVMAHPWPFLIGAGALVVTLALPAREMRGWNIDARSLPPDVESRRGFEILREQFSVGWMGPSVLVFECAPGHTVWERGVRGAILDQAAQIGRDPRVDHVLGFVSLADALEWLPDSARSADELPALLRPTAREVASADGRQAIVAVLPRLDPPSREAAAFVSELRAAGFPIARAAGLRVRVGGPAAGLVDFDRELFGAMPRVVAAVLLLTFVMLLVQFRSLVIPLKAIVLNLFSVLAAYGFLVLVFQHGVGARLLRLDPPGGLNSFIVLMLFTILFGLSMDYEVFLLSRIRDAYDRLGDTRAAVAAGLQETAGTITGAALIMVSIFASFGFTRLTATREFGLGLAFAVALDATLIRVVLVPALMVLAGPLNWWLPGRGAPRVQGR